MKDAIAKSSISDKDSAYKAYLEAVDGKSNSDAREIAKDILGEPVFWSWERKCHPSFDVVSFLI